jgi:hypothetical protein
MSRARSFGRRLDVEIVGDPAGITRVEGPALVHNPVLASCGVGRRLGSGALVIVPGPPDAPLATSFATNGLGEWFTVDRSGAGQHPATRAFVALCRDRRPIARDLSRKVLRLFDLLGCPPEPALLDVLFQGESPMLTRVGASLRAGRAIARSEHPPLTRFLVGGNSMPDPLPDDVTWEDLQMLRSAGRAAPLLDGLSVGARAAVEEWFDDLEELDGGGAAYGALAAGLSEAASHLLSLPMPGMLPPLPPALDAVAVGLGAALGAAQPPHDASRAMLDTFRFLGGRFTSEARYPVVIDEEPAPEDRLARWAWFCGGASRAAKAADALWRRVTDMDS